MTIQEQTQIINTAYVIGSALIGAIISLVTTRVSYGARITALEDENKRFKKEDYGPFKQSVKDENLTVWAKLEAISTQQTQLLTTVTEVKTIVTMMQKNQ